MNLYKCDLPHLSYRYQKVKADLGIESFETWTDPRTDNVQLEIRYEQGNKKKFELSPEFVEDYGLEDVLILLHA